MTEHVIHCPNLATARPYIPCEELAAINHDMFNAESLATMNATRISIYGRMNHAHDPLTSKLPPEIVSLVFTNFLPAYAASFYGIQRGGKVVHTTPLLLGAVCTAWRAIVWSTPLLWTSIYINLANFHFNKADISILDEWLGRSGGLPLFIGISRARRSMTSMADTAEKVMQSLAPYAHRWAYLALYDPQGLFRYLQPMLSHAFMLHTLKIRTTSRIEEIDLGQIPNLKKLYMDHLQADKLLNVHWDHLEAVNVDIPSIDMCYDLFAEASFMTKIAFGLQPCESKYTTRNVVLQHNHLTGLFLKHWNKPTSVLLALMAFPALQHLDIVCPGPVAVENITSLLRRSRCTLTWLKLDLTHTKMEVELHLIPFLAEIPSLEVLGLRRTDVHRQVARMGPVDPLLTRLSETARTQETGTIQPAFLPQLEELCITNMALSYDRVLDVLRAHAEDPAGLMAPRSREGCEKRQYTRLLRSLYIEVLAGTEGYEMVELEVAQQLQRAVEGGFGIRIVAESHGGGFVDLIDEALHPVET